MKTIKVSICWSGNNYCAQTHSDELNGIIVSTHKTLEGVKTEFLTALKFHIEGCIKDGDTLPDWIISEHFELNYFLEKTI